MADNARPATPASTATRSNTTLERTKTEVFGENPALGRDGEPLERGRGSAFEAASPAAKAHFHAASAHAAADEVAMLARQLAAAATKLGDALKATVDAADAAKKST